MGDVAERARVDHHRLPFGSLHQVGLNRYLSSDIIEPTAPTSVAVIGFPSLVNPTTTRDSLERRSSRPDDSASTAMTSDAVTMSKPVSRTGALAEPPSPR